jgi:hypothetical protein
MRPEARSLQNCEGLPEAAQERAPTAYTTSISLTAGIRATPSAPRSAAASLAMPALSPMGRNAPGGPGLARPSGTARPHLRTWVEALGAYAADRRWQGVAVCSGGLCSIQCNAQPIPQGNQCVPVQCTSVSQCTDVPDNGVALSCTANECVYGCNEVSDSCTP